MTRLTWSGTGERFYEAGVDRGVLYVDEAGVPWNGLTAVNQTSSGGEPTPYYLDGYKYRNLSSEEEFEASIGAYSYPDEFKPCIGVGTIVPGFYMGQQPKVDFGFSYRTLIGNDVDGIDNGYKIHIVYNALADSEDSSYGTLTDQTDPLNFTWNVATKPPRISGYKSSSHFIIDSRLVDPDALTRIEDILYGTVSVDSRLPSSLELIYLMAFSYYRTNLAVNPNLSYSPSTSTLPVSRTNYATNPYFKTLGSANTNGSTGTWSDMTTGGPAGVSAGKWRKYTMTVINSTSPISLSCDLPTISKRVAALPGEIWTASFYAYADLGTSGRTARIDYAFYNSSNVIIGSVTAGSTTTVVNLSWVRASATITAPANTAYIGITASISGSSGTVGNGILGFTECLIEKEETLYDALSGTYSADTRLTAAFSGSADASTTIGLAAGLFLSDVVADTAGKMGSATTLMAGSSSTVRRTRDSSVAHEGTYAGVIVPTGTSNSSYVDIYGTTALTTPYLLPGRTYRMSAWLRRKGVMRAYKALATNSQHSRLIGYYQTPGQPASTFTTNLGTQGPNSNAESQSTLTMAIPSNSLGGLLRVVNGSPNPSDPLWFDCVIIEDVTASVPSDSEFFDGNTVDTTLARYEWTGTADQSTSTKGIYFV